MEQCCFLLKSFFNIDNFLKEVEACLANLTRRSVQSSTRHLQCLLPCTVNVYIPGPSMSTTLDRQCLLPWTKPWTSHLLRKKESQKRAFLRPTSYRKAFAPKLQNMVSDLIEQDCKGYQNRLLGSRKSGMIFQHLKSLLKHSNFPFEME